MAYLRASAGLWQIDIFAPGEDGELSVSSFVQTAPGTWKSIAGFYGDSGLISESHWRGPPAPTRAHTPSTPSPAAGRDDRTPRSWPT